MNSTDAKHQAPGVPTPAMSDDLLRGVKSISQFTGLPERRVLNLAQTGALPIFKVGRLWHARRSTLLAEIRRRENSVGEAV